jgi:hypothetical protein
MWPEKHFLQRTANGSNVLADSNRTLWAGLLLHVSDHLSSSSYLQCQCLVPTLSCHCSLCCFQLTTP